MLQQETVQCLVLDIILPGMNGFEVCRHIRSHEAWKSLPIIVTSTKNASSDRFWAKRQGANQYLTKPFKGDELVQMVKELLQENAHSPQAAARPSVDFKASVTSPSTPIPPIPHISSTDRVHRSYRATDATGPQRPVQSGTDEAYVVVEPTEPPIFPARPRPSTPPGSSTSKDFTPPLGNQTSPVSFPPFLPSYPPPQVNSTQAAGKLSNFGGPAQPAEATGPIHSVAGGTGPLRPMAGGIGSNRPMAGGGEPQPLIATLIPKRSNDTELLWSTSPQILAISDRQARHLYLTIDGLKNIETLSTSTRMSKDEVINALRLLLEEKLICLYEPNGHLIDHPNL